MATKMLNTVMMVDTVREEEKVIMVEVMAGEEEGVIVEEEEETAVEEAEEGAVGEAEETAVVVVEGEEEATEQQCSVSSFQQQAALKENFGLRSKKTQGGKTVSLYDGSATGRFLDY